MTEEKSIPRKLSLVLGYECNNNCIFCYAGEGYKRNVYPSMTTEEAKRRLDEAKKRGTKMVDFLGGEPTIRKDLPELIEYAKNIGFTWISITTNGRLLSYRDYAKKLIDKGLTSAIFSIHGHNAKIHDNLTRATGSYEQLVKGMKNIREFGGKDFYICTNTTIVKGNYMYLPQIAENNIKLGTDACEFIFVHPRGNALKYFDKVVPRLTDVAPYIGPTLEVGKKYKIKHFVFRYFPMCFMLGHFNNLSEFIEKQFMREEHVGPEFEDLNVEKGRATVGRVKGPQCKACKYYNVCEGVFKEYADHYGFDELTPV